MMNPSVILSVLSVVQLLFSLFLQLIIMNIFGIDVTLDVYLASNTINFILVTVANNIINFSVTPYLTRYVTRKRFKTFAYNGSTLINIFLIGFLILAIIQTIFSSAITELLFSGFQENDKELLEKMFIMQGFISIISVIIGVLTAINYALNRLKRTILLPIVSIIAQIVAVCFLHDKLGVYSLVVALAINQILNAVLLSFDLLKFYYFRISINNDIQEIFRKMFPLFCSSSFSKTDVVFDRYFASALAAGSITMLYYGNMAVTVLSSVISRGISITSLRKMSELEKEPDIMHLYFIKLYKIMLLLTFSVSMLVVLFGKLGLSLVVFTGKISPEQIDGLYTVILCFLGVFIGGSLSSVLVNAFYAKGYTGLVSFITISMYAAGLVAKVIFFKIYGFYTLPLVFSIKSIITTVLLLIMYHFYIHKIMFKEIFMFPRRLHKS